MSFLSRPVASRRQVLRKLRTFSCSATLQELPDTRAARLEVLRELRHTGVIAIASRRKAEFMGVFQATQAGTTRLSATGELPCHKSTPPCSAPTLGFQVTLVIQDAI